MGKELTIAQLTFVDLYDSYTLSLSSDVIAVPCNPDGEALNTTTYKVKYSIRAGEKMIAAKCESAELSSSTISGITITPSDSSESAEGTISVKVNSTTKIPEDSGINISVKTNDSNEFVFNRFISFMNIKSGQDGKSIESVTEYYAATSTNTKPGNNEWGTTIPSKYGKDYPYLWNYSSIGYSSGNPDSSEAQIIAYWGQDGGTGKGISRIEEWYATNNSPEDPPNDTTGGWTTSLKVPTSDERYLWNYEKIYYTEGDPVSTNKRVIGVHGENGESAFVLKVVPDKGSVFKEGIEEIKLSLEAYEGTNKINEAVPYEWSYYNFERDEWKSPNNPEVIQGKKTDGVNACVLGSDDYYVINMNEKDNSYSIIKLKYTIAYTTNLILRCISYGESTYDYMLVSPISTDDTCIFASTHNVDDSEIDKAKHCFKGNASLNPVDVTFTNIIPGTYYIYIKVRKDSSKTQPSETFKFKCLENYSPDLIENISLTVNNSYPYAYSMFKCQITYNGVVYSDYETLQQDVQNVYHAETEIVDGGDLFDGNYAVVQVRLYKNGEEIDPIPTKRVYYNNALTLTDNGSGIFRANDTFKFFGDEVNGDYAYFLMHGSMQYFEYTTDQDAAEYAYSGGSMYEKSSGDYYYHQGSYADNYDSKTYKLILAKFDGDYWKPYKPYDAYEYCYINSQAEEFGNITFGNSKVFIIDKRKLPAVQSFNIEIYEKAYDNAIPCMYYVPINPCNNTFTVYDLWKIRTYVTGSDTYITSCTCSSLQSIKTKYIEEVFSRQADGVYINQVVTEVDSVTGEKVETTPFFVKLASEEIGFYSSENTQTPMVHIGNKSTHIRNSVLDDSAIIHGTSRFNNDIVLAQNQSQTSGFRWTFDSDGSLSLVVINNLSEE